MAKIKHISVISSNVGTVGYDPESMTLEVRFKAHRLGEVGVLYSYVPVTVEEFQGLLTATSKGKYLNSQIIGNPKIACKRI